MICAGWIRFRASLMAMRRVSWIDQRINDDVAMRWFLPWFGASFFLTAADWRGGGSPPSWRRRASPGRRGEATPTRICYTLYRPPPVFRWMFLLDTRW